jgi:hypothetical protein
MPRGRKPLTDKQERILVQCQLMGMTTADLVTISNRLKALDAEREFKSRVAEITHGFFWTVKKPRREFTITDSAGHVYDVKVRSDYGRRTWSQQCHDFAEVTMTKPGTRFKAKTVTDHGLRDDWGDNEISSVCPEGNKYLYRMMRDIKNGRFKE